ncbi:hypothetical protein [Streptomyces atriruber]|uniref:hypothetical protein n=1 Tax=Streptomyces atriruber TaxID=545121 RepID=UPI0006E4553B|nr:hypothetical protein [Streptomyces atriruber]
MARHAVKKLPRSGSRALLRAGLTVTAAGAALGVGGTASAGAVEPGPAASPVQALTAAVHHSAAGGLAPVKDLQLDPLANTSADPLDNTLGTQVADFKPVDTGFVTGPLASGASLGDLPVVGGAAGLLPS